VSLALRDVLSAACATPAILLVISPLPCAASLVCGVKRVVHFLCSSSDALTLMPSLSVQVISGICSGLFNAKSLVIEGLYRYIGSHGVFLQGQGKNPHVYTRRIDFTVHLS
jgi:di/tricarboxylate transporter